MSMILEALRKSEAERQRGRAPGLFVEQRPAVAADRRVPAWAWGLGLLLVAVLAAWGWREWQRALPVPAAPAPDAVVEAAPGPVAERVDELPGRLEILNLPDDGARPTTPLPAPPMPIRVEPSVVEPVVREPAAIAPAATAMPAATPAETVSATPPPVPADAPAPLPGLGSLAASERASLPPLKLSMHVFAENPGQRFVILDGQRLGEGASPAAGVVLEEIRRDGLVLSVNGQRLLLARP